MKHEVFFKEYAHFWEEPVMTLATASALGKPHAAAVYFAVHCQSQPGNSLRLYFFSDPQSQHSQDLQNNPQAAAEIHPAAGSWLEIQGLQLYGIVTPLLRGAGWDAAWEIYATKFPFVSSLRAIVARNVLYCFQTSWLRLTDNRKGFGYKAEWLLS